MAHIGNDARKQDEQTCKKRFGRHEEVDKRDAPFVIEKVANGIERMEKDHTEDRKTPQLVNGLDPRTLFNLLFRGIVFV